MSTTSPTSGTVRLPGADGSLRTHVVGPRSEAFDLAATVSGQAPRSRSVYAAAHVVGNPFADPAEQGTSKAIDWHATLAFREHVWNLGLGVAEAMDTAQRGAGLDWPLAKDLIARSGAAARDRGGAIVCGALTDQLDASQRWPAERLVDAYLEQASWIREHAGTPVLMASRHLAATAETAEDYERVYDAVISQSEGSVFLHWLGEAFDPSLVGYWGSTDLDEAAETFLSLVERHRSKVAGVKISLLDEQREIDVRRRLPTEVLMHTGDDFNYVPLIAGDEKGHSHALLGVFDAIAAPARAAFARLDDGDTAGFRQFLDPTVPLARHLFTAPTSAYKTGVVFLAWLNGHQDHFRMLVHAQNQRSVPHLAEVFALADQAGALADPDLAVHRMRAFLAVAGVDA
jgi:hypothetical protein